MRLAVAAPTEEADTKGAAVQRGDAARVCAPLGLGLRRACASACQREYQDAAVEGRSAGGRQGPAPAVQRHDLRAGLGASIFWKKNKDIILTQSLEYY